MSKNYIYQFHKTIQNKGDFKKFLELLKADYKNNPNSWGNNRLDLFLEGLYGYNYLAEDPEEKPSWQLFAEMLLAAKVYE